MGLKLGSIGRSVAKISAPRLAFVVGLLALLAYWYSVHPMDFARGYTEDWCHPEQTRQLVAEAIERGGSPFRTPSFGAPTGIALPFMSWGMEISWLGGYFWRLNRDFPYLWALFGFSLVISYLGVGAILKRMKIAAAAAWAISLGVVLMHVPRHFKIWHHFEHLLEHWVYWSFFLDAWIWQRFWRERRWSWSLEAWRALCLCGMMTTAGYFWGPLIVLWGLVRASMLAVGVSRWAVSRRGSPERAEASLAATEIEGAWRQALPPALIGLLLVALELKWYLPLKAEVERFGEVWQGNGWFGHWPYLVRPLWLDDLAAFAQRRVNPYNSFETIITPGWFYLVPAFAGLVTVAATGGARRKGRLIGAAAGVARAIGTVLPFLLFFAVAIVYIEELILPDFAPFLQRTVPFLKFFRVATRWGLFFPALFGVMVVLCWPELSGWVRQAWRQKRKFALALVGLFAVSSLFELAQLRKPFSTMPALSDSAVKLLEGVKQAPGDSVLDLPFCLAGGNAVCTQELCPNYPASTTGACFRGWHDKKVYGIYASRLTFGQCDAYKQPPYTSWFDAWGSQRCFTEPEWKDFCAYLDAHVELSAVLLYPDIWVGAGTPECMGQFRAHLGEPIAEASFAGFAVRGDEPPRMSRVMRFGARCR